MTGYIIEHDTRGVLVDQDYDPGGKGPNVYLDWRSRFSTVRRRSEGWRMVTDAEARIAWSRLSPALRRSAKVRRWGTWSTVANPEKAGPMSAADIVDDLHGAEDFAAMAVRTVEQLLAAMDDGSLEMIEAATKNGDYIVGGWANYCRPTCAADGPREACEDNPDTCGCPCHDRYEDTPVLVDPDEPDGPVL